MQALTNPDMFGFFWRGPFLVLRLLLMNIAFCYRCTRPTRMSSWRWARARTDVRVPAVKRCTDVVTYHTESHCVRSQTHCARSNFNISTPVNTVQRMAGSLYRLKSIYCSCCFAHWTCLRWINTFSTMFRYLKCYLKKTNVRFYLKVIFHFFF